MFGLNADVISLPVGQCFCQLSLWEMSILGLSTLVFMQADSLTAVCKASNKETTNAAVAALIPSLALSLVKYMPFPTCTLDTALHAVAVVLLSH